jgi:uncharacterized protein YciI
MDAAHTMHKTADVPTYLCLLRRSGPSWDPTRPPEEQTGWTTHAAYLDGLVDSGALLLGGPLADEHRVVLVLRAPTAADARALLTRDPWHESHLEVDSITAWTIRLAAPGLR